MNGRSAQWIWAGLSLAGLVVAFLASGGIAVTLLSRGLLPNVADGLRLDLALFLLLFGLLGMVGVLVAARLAFGRWLEVRTGQLVFPLVGVGLAIGEELALHEWAEASIGHYDWDFIGWTAALSFGLVVLAVASLGLAIAPASARLGPATGIRLAAVLVLFAVLTNVPNLVDGIGPSSWPLVLLVGMSGLYALVAVARIGRT